MKCAVSVDLNLKESWVCSWVGIRDAIYHGFVPFGFLLLDAGRAIS
jgi:hypothetical protein